MRTSFYFVLWIVIYPLLGLLHNPFINANSFIIALLLVWLVSHFINKTMPDIMTYERKLQIYPILEDIYSGNVASFKRRFSVKTVISVISAIYFVVATVMIVLTFFSDFDDWIALAIFIFLSYSTMRRSVQMVAVNTNLKHNPTPENCVRIAENIYGLNYEAYYQARVNVKTPLALYPPKPKTFRIFQIVSILFAVASTIMGLFCLLQAALSVFLNHSFAGQAIGGMLLFYGLLAVYYGINDIIEIAKEFAYKNS